MSQSKDNFRVMMKKFIDSKSISALLLALGGVIIYFVSLNEVYISKNNVKEGKDLFKLVEIKKKLSRSFGKNEWQKKVSLVNRDVGVKYTFDEGMTSYIENILKRYRSDYSSIVVIDNNSGKIISSVGYQRKNNKIDNSLPFTSTHPAASIFKIITTAALLKKTNINNETIFNFRGRGSTLYKYQLRNKMTKWTRKTSLEKAFASSNNVVFGKAAINNISENELYNIAIRFGFNKELMEEIDISKSVFTYPINEYNMAELACGFNQLTTISPVHAASIASIIANDGQLKVPTIIENIWDLKTGKSVKLVEVLSKKVIEKSVTKSIRAMMERTVSRGTARGSFRRMNKYLKSDLEIGGKTGSITGGMPRGKRDWFVGYARPKNSKDRGISISVMNINQEKWYVRSPYLARKIIENYYKKFKLLNKIDVVAEM